MKRPVMLFLAGCALALHAQTAGAQAPDCSKYSEANLMSWPADAPVWEFCWRRLRDSAPQPHGSGVELFEVTYNGHRVFDRLNVPVLNVEYGPGGCNCFRDWLDQEVRFEAIGAPCGNGYCEVFEPARTVCDCAPTDTCDTNPNNACNVDLGSFTGVAAQKEPARLVMTSQATAGWYRYTHTWTFYLDGTIEPGFGFSSTPNPCTDTTHFHHGYYRMDFDIDGPANDTILREVVPDADSDTDGDGLNDAKDNCTKVANADQRDTDGDGYGNMCDADLDGSLVVNFADLALLKEAFFSNDPDADFDGSGTVNFNDLGIMKAAFFQPPGPSGLVPEQVAFAREKAGYRGDIVAWVAMDTVTGRGYRLVPGPVDQDLPIDTFDPKPFAKGDYWVLAAHDDEDDDHTSSCSTQLDEFVDGEAAERTDVLLWYRFGDPHQGHDECQCGRVGPRLVPIGDWSPAS